MTDPGVVSAAILSSTQAFTVFTQLLPRISEVRKADRESDPGMAGDVRFGEVAASVVTIGTGSIISSLVKSRTPLGVAIAVSAGYVLLYEIALRGKRPLDYVPRSSNE